MDGRIWAALGLPEGGDIIDPGEQARLLHSRWLTDALASRRDYPRIPLHAVGSVDEDDAAEREQRRDRGERWWRLALEQMD